MPACIEGTVFVRRGKKVPSVLRSVSHGTGPHRADNNPKPAQVLISFIVYALMSPAVSRLRRFAPLATSDAAHSAGGRCTAMKRTGTDGIVLHYRRTQTPPYQLGTHLPFFTYD